MKENNMETKLQQLDMDTLENVSGGLTEQSETYLNEQLRDLKAKYGTVDNVLLQLKNNYNTLGLAEMGITEDEAENYAKTYYDFY